MQPSSASSQFCCRRRSKQVLTIVFVVAVVIIIVVLELNLSRRVRSPVPLGLWIEGELAVQALYSGIEARPLPVDLPRLR